MKTSFDVGLVEVESNIILKKDICDNNFLTIIMCFQPKIFYFLCSKFVDLKGTRNLILMEPTFLFTSY